MVWITTRRLDHFAFSHSCEWKICTSDLLGMNQTSYCCSNSQFDSTKQRLEFTVRLAERERKNPASVSG